MANRGQEARDGGQADGGPILPKTQGDMARIIQDAVANHHPLIREGDPIVVLGYDGDGNWFVCGSAEDIFGSQAIINRKRADDQLYNPQENLGPDDRNTIPTWFRPYYRDGSIPVPQEVELGDTDEVVSLPPWPVITLPEGKRAELEEKLVASKGTLRVIQRQHPVVLADGLEAMYTIVILEPLLETGSVDTLKVLLDLKKRFGDEVDMEKLIDACVRIYYSCETKEKEGTAGSDLSKAEKPQE